MYLETKIITLVIGILVGTISFDTINTDRLFSIKNQQEVIIMQPQEVITIDAITLEPSNYDKRLRCMTEVIYYEAGGESFEGKKAVAQVVINRTQHGSYPTDICDVVYQKSVHKGKILCQFSWVCQQRKREIDIAMWRESKYIAHLALTMSIIHVNLAMNNALFFHSTSVKPGWNYNKINQIGNHIFYAAI